MYFAPPRQTLKPGYGPDARPRTKLISSPVSISLPWRRNA